MRQAYGVVLGEVEDIVETALAGPAEAELLEVDTGLPMLLIHRLGRDTAGWPVEWTRSVYPATGSGSPLAAPSAGARALPASVPRDDAVCAIEPAPPDCPDGRVEPSPSLPQDMANTIWLTVNDLAYSIRVIPTAPIGGTPLRQARLICDIESVPGGL